MVGPKRPATAMSRQPPTREEKPLVVVESILLYYTGDHDSKVIVGTYSYVILT